MSRENGFDWPLHPLQCLTWALFPTILFDFYFVLLPVVPEPWRWAACGVYSCVAAVTFASAWITAAVDPRDPHVRREPGGGRSGRELGGDFEGRPPRGSRLAACCAPLSVSPLAGGCLRSRKGRDAALARAASEETCLCYLCQAHVFASSKHCRFCDKCVLRFDHHCKWLNTCVGSKNYAYFLAVIGSTCCFTFLQLCLSCYVAVEVTHPRRKAASEVCDLARRHALADAFGLSGYVVVVYAYAALLLPLVVLIGQLGFFHAMLVRQDLTTYEYILQEQRKELEDLTQSKGGDADQDDDDDDDGPLCTPCTKPAKPDEAADAAARGDGGAKDDAGLELVPTRGAGDDAPPEAPSPDKKRDHFQLEIVDGYDAVPLGTTQNL